MHPVYSWLLCIYLMLSSFQQISNRRWVFGDYSTTISYLATAIMTWAMRTSRISILISTRERKLSKWNKEVDKTTKTTTVTTNHRLFTYKIERQMKAIEITKYKSSDCLFSHRKKSFCFFGKYFNPHFDSHIYLWCYLFARVYLCLHSSSMIFMR